MEVIRAAVAIPIPDAPKRGKKISKYPLGLLSVGGPPLFFVGATLPQLIAAVKYHKKKNREGKYTVRHIKDGVDFGRAGVMGVAVWRTE